MSRITDFDTADIRFLTSLSLDGSDAMNPDPDYSAAYLRISTDAPDGLVGHGFVFTIGRGNDVQEAAIEVLRERFVGRDIRIAVDANQRWDVAEAIEWMRALTPYDVAWIEEPTSPDDVLGHAAIARGVAPTPVATGEHLANRVMAKQFLQAGALQVLQIDATRVAGVNENVAIILLAAKFGVPVCPHAGGVGLCEAVQHLAMFDSGRSRRASRAGSSSSSTTCTSTL